MRRRSRTAAATAALLLLSGSLAAADFAESVGSVVKTYCTTCHGDGAEPAGGLRLTPLLNLDSTQENLPAAARVLELVAAGQMPPAGLPAPTEAERRRLVETLEDLLSTPPPGGADPGKPVLRRLTRLEYNNSVRDLLGLSTDVFMFPERLPYLKTYFQPQFGKLDGSITVERLEYGQEVPVLLRNSSLPGENRAEHGFTNRGADLSLSPMLFEKYLALAAEIAGHPELEARSPAVRLLTAPPGDQPPEEVARVRVARFLERAFRRPPTSNEIELTLRPFHSSLDRGETFASGMRAAIRAVLASPQFLMRAEPVRVDAGETRPLDSYELASRLSYFLWSSMPDEELFELARDGLLADPVILESQARRMLRDPKARELSDSFAFQWLQLSELFGAQPDLETFRHYYSFDFFGSNKGNRGQDMLTELLLLFETVLIEDRPVLDFVDADYVWVNDLLMEHYGWTELYPKKVKDSKRYGSRLSSARWHRVQPPDRTRGGVVTAGGPLTMNSTPVRTSPVFRGAWVLEVIFNRPPPPPPNVDVGSIEEGESGDAALTVRQKLEAHRANPACASCHNRIDPPGFALERFDPVGAWREVDAGAPIDASGELSHGRSFDGPAAFKAALLERPEDFVGAFAEQLLSYALGRKLEHFDRPAVKAVVDGAAEEDYRFSRIVADIVMSRPFRHVRNTADGGSL